MSCGIACRNTILSYHLPAFFSIFSATFFTIEIALKLISSYSHKHFIIYTDLRSILGSLQSNLCSPSFISVLHLCNELSNRGFHILLCWAPAHVWIKGNEAADKAAKQAVNLSNSPVSYSGMKLEVTSYIRTIWQREWDWPFDNNLKDIKPHNIKWPIISPRKNDIILTHLRIGHSWLTHRHLFLAEEQPICHHFHSSSLTIHHILTDCVGLRHKYRHYFHSSSPSLTNLVGENPHPELFNFLKDINFYHEI